MLTDGNTTNTKRSIYNTQEPIKEAKQERCCIIPRTTDIQFISKIMEKTYKDFLLKEASNDIPKFHREFNRYYRSGKKLSFKEWIGAMSDLFDILE